MSCREWEEPISLLVDGEPGIAGLAEHLEDCDGCRQLYQGLRADQAALQVTPTLDSAACETLRNDVFRRIGRHRRTVNRWYVAAGAIAAGLMIVRILVRIPGRRVESVAEKPKPTTEPQVPKRVPSPPGQVARVHKSLKKRVRSPIAATAVELAI